MPLTFMGNALGILHVASAEGAAPDKAQIEGITTLAKVSGARIGTLRALAQAQIQAMTDALTGLSNRRDAEARMQRLLERNDRLAVVMIDIDRFKLLNDTYGHEAGDRALRLFSRTLTQSVREGDLVARWGGEEFLLAFPGLSSVDASELVERIRVALDGSAVRAGLPSFAASFGIADKSLSRSVEQLIRLADNALYQAKAAGRNCALIAQDGVAQPAYFAPRSDGDDGDDGQPGGDLTGVRSSAARAFP